MKKTSKSKMVFLIMMMVIILSATFWWIYANRPVSYKIVFIPKTTDPQFDFWQTIYMGAELAAKEENASLEWRGAYYEKDIEAQKLILKRAIKEKPDIIILAAADTKALTDLIKQAKKEKITLLTVDSRPEGIKGNKHVATNNIEAAEALTRYAVQSIGRQGEVIMVNFFEGTSTAKEREQGYKQEIVKYPNIIMRSTVYTEGTVEGAYKVAKEIIKKYPNLKVIIGANQQMADGICDAVQELGVNGKIKVVGFDSSQRIIYALEKGIMDAIIVQRPFNMGYLSVKYAIEAKEGKSVPEFIDTGYKFIDKETLYSTENQKLLFPIIK